MDQNAQNPTAPVAPPPPEQPVQNVVTATQPSRGSNVMLMLLIGLVMLGLGLGGGYLLFGNPQNYSQIPQQNTQQVSPTVMETISVPTSSVPTDWVVESSTACNIVLPVPPKKAPYYIPDDAKTSPDLVDDDGHFWIFENTKNSEDTLLPNVSLVTYRNPNAGGSGYVPGQVIVRCGLNSNKYTTAQFADTYTKRFSEYPDSDIKVTKKEAVTLWGKELMALTITGGMFNPKEPTYVLATNDKLYTVNKVSMSKNNQVKETTQQIFDNLQFTD